VEIIAHRGASYDAPENTLASVNLAWQQNADAVEVDVHLSRDGKLVVTHDANTWRTAGIRRTISGQTVAELKTLDFGRWKDRKWAGERISTLEEVLATVSEGKRLFVEIKCGAECLLAFEKGVRSSGWRPDQIVAIGFALDMMKTIKRRLPEIEVCWIAAFKRSWRTGRWSPKPETLIEKTKAAGLDGLDLGARGPINRQFVKQAHEANLKIYVWTVDSPAKATKLLDAGVDGITTNRPEWLRVSMNTRRLISRQKVCP
jgi:glycerophosphoryl diester phosphodiesterase